MSSSLLKCKIAIEGVKKVCVCVHECIHVHVYVCCYTFINVLQVYEQTELKIDPAWNLPRLYDLVRGNQSAQINVRRVWIPMWRSLRILNVQLC